MPGIPDYPSLDPMADDDLFVVHNQASGATRSVERLAALRSLPTDTVDTQSIEDGAVTADKLDANAIGHGFLEIARTTLGSAGDTITVASIPARKYLRIYVRAIASGSIGGNMQFNGDTGNNYARRNVVGTTVTTGTSASSWLFNNNTGSENFFTTIEITNEATVVKQATSETIQSLGAASSAPTYIDSRGKWSNNSNQITSLVVNNPSTGDFDVGSEVVVFGSN